MSRSDSVPPPSGPALSRRALLRAGAALPLCLVRWPADRETQQELAPLPPPVFRISLAQWSLHRRLYGKAEPALAPLDFMREARRLGFSAVDYVNSFYKESIAERGFVREWKKRADEAGVESRILMCDGLGALGDPDAKERKAAVERHRVWLDAIRTLGGQGIRVNAQSSGAPDEQQKLVADGLTQLLAHAAPLGLDVLVENHGGLSSDPNWLVGVMKAVGHARCGTLPDFGNFRISAERSFDPYEGVRLLMPFAKCVSAKSYDFDAEGRETRIDYPRMLGIVLDSGYRGYIGVEYEGGRLPEVEGIRRTEALLRKLRSEYVPKGPERGKK